MSFEVTDGEGIQALYHNLEVKRSNGWAVVEPGTGACEVISNTGTLGTGEDTITIQAGSVLLDGTVTAVPEQTLSIPEGSTDPRKDIIHIDSQGNPARVSGYPEALQPDASPLLESERPAPDALVGSNNTPLAIVGIPANATDIDDTNILDIRRRGELDLSHLSTDTATVDTEPSTDTDVARLTDIASHIDGINLEDSSISVSDITDIIAGDNLSLDDGYSAGTVRIDASGGDGSGGTDGPILGFVGEFGTETATGDGQTRVFAWQHNVSDVIDESDLSVDVQATVESSSTDFWLSDVTSTEIIIEYASAPADGATLEWYWEAWKKDSSGGVTEFIEYEPVAEPGSPTSGWRMYTDTSDGSLKAKSENGEIVTIASMD